MKYKARGNFVVISGILVAAVVGAVSYFTWEFLNAPAPPPQPKILYGASPAVYVASAPDGEKAEDVPSAVVLGANKGLTGIARGSKGGLGSTSASTGPGKRNAAKGVPRTIAESGEKGRWIFIDKANFRLYLAEGTNVVDSWGIAVGKVPGNKTKSGDMRTPEGANFTVLQIQNSSSWTHDFKDGKGVIENAYGPWFIRLKCGWQGIGIHGTHDPASIGTLATEGCVRMNNDDLEKLKSQVGIGMKVVIGPNATVAAPEKKGQTKAETSARKVPDEKKTRRAPAKNTTRTPAKKRGKR